MKYLNRQRLGVEAFLAARSGVFSRNNELTPDELITRLRVQPYSVRNKVAQDVKSAIVELTSGKYDVGSIIPPHIIALCEDSCNPERVGKMRPFFAWLQSLWKDNDLARTEWISRLKAVANDMNDASGECLMAVGTSYNNQRALMEQLDDGCIELSFHERSWGRLSLIFKDCDGFDEQDVPVLGFIYMIEGEPVGDGRFRFEILFDTEFLPKSDAVRALRPDSWRQVSFTCSAPQVELVPINYALAAHLRGASRLETVRYSSIALCEKLSFAGSAMLSAAERRMLPVAKLISASKVLAEKDMEIDIRSDSTLTELAENHYVLTQLSDFFESRNALPLSRLLEKITECSDCDDIDGAFKGFKKVPEMMDELCACGELMPFLERFHGEMLNVGECEEVSHSREAVFRSAACCFGEALEERLNKLGFSGEYPHYRRMRRGKAEYVTAIIVRESEMLPDGNLAYGFALCAAQVKTKRAERKKGIIRGIPFEKSCAADFLNERPEYSNSGIVDCLSQSDCAYVDVDIIEAKATLSDESSVDKMVKCVKRAMNGRSLKRAERKARRSRVDKAMSGKEALRSYFFAFARFMPTSNIMCVVMMILYLWGREQLDVIAALNVRVALIPIALAGVVTALLRALLYCLHRRKKLWMY